MNYYYQIEGHLRNNIGDVLQGMVAKRFLPGNARVADREALADLNDKGKLLLIANGWYMHSFDKFPPPENVSPVYASVHIANSALLLSTEVRAHFKKHSPIGCRDKKTLKLFLGWGIPAYYSGCLTTTCVPRTSVIPTTGDVLLVDNVDHPIPEDVRIKLERLAGKPLTSISHNPPDISGTIEEYAQKSEQHMESLLTKYCNAELLITTKIHCALPCLGMGVKVLFIHPNPLEERLEPLSQFIEIISYEDVKKMDSLEVPVVNQDVLNRRKKFLSDFVSKAIEVGYNPLAKPDSFSYAFINLKSRVLAFLFRKGVLFLQMFGIANSKINRVFNN
ncbi:polysaccharide pyruvyl transferase family protein [Cytophagaceae bacterium ABcell3]|nr:polysaccharide pyruvyl transferase family protein [Cytophagaceae bacterium ABcell3]